NVIREVVLANNYVTGRLANGWVHVSVPLSQLNPNNLAISGVQLKNATNADLATVHLDDVQLVTTATTAPGVSLSPASLTFAGQTVTTTSAARALTLTNSSTAPLTIGGIAASGDFAQSN